jgi:phosphonate transport system ATP-binding protein
VVHNVNAGRLHSWGPARSLWSLLRPQGLADARDALAQVGLADRLLDRTEWLSGGEQQRVAIARLLLQRPALVLADEPASALDPVRAAEVLELLTGLVATSRTALVLSVHDLALARRYCTRLVGLVHGRVRVDAPLADVSDLEVAALYGDDRPVRRR